MSKQKKYLEISDTLYNSLNSLRDSYLEGHMTSREYLMKVKLAIVEDIDEAIEIVTVIYGDEI